MLSARTIFEEVFGNDEAFRLFCSIAASGEAQGGWRRMVSLQAPARRNALGGPQPRHREPVP